MTGRNYIFFLGDLALATISCNSALEISHFISARVLRALNELDGTEASPGTSSLHSLPIGPKALFKPQPFSEHCWRSPHLHHMLCLTTSMIWTWNCRLIFWHDPSPSLFLKTYFVYLTLICRLTKRLAVRPAPRPYDLDSWLDHAHFAWVLWGWALAADALSCQPLGSWLAFP